jgi:hypothetical protein
MRTLVLFGCAFGLIIGLAAMAAEKPASEPTAKPVSDPATLQKAKTPPKEHSYVGAGMCKLCHLAPSTGAQYTIWKKNPHARAYATLGTAEAKAVGEKLGIANPQEAMECLRCHVTAIDKPEHLRTLRWNKEEGTSCETCHGPGGDYMTTEIMQDRALAEANGLIHPTEKLCRGCHNEESPSFHGFDYAEAKEKIAHPRPRKKEDQ